ncbi:MAG: hypothetical protein HY827_00990 [Actinobacteria bacterium]|nr:hypothetical protein [Actinomycetota bacterium]
MLLAVIVTLAAGSTPAAASTVSGAISSLEQSGSITTEQADYARGAYMDARTVRRAASGASRQAMRYQIRRVENLARDDRITAGRMRPLFETLQRNADWFHKNGPRPFGTDDRFGNSRIIYQYFPGQGWEFHPLSNFAKLNAVWTVKSKPARRALGKYAHELIDWAVDRGGALTWEYYFPFSGSDAPFISSISQGTAIQALARAGNALNDAEITAAARKAMLAFDNAAPVGLKLPRDVGNHYLGYSGNSRLIILNMFLQSLDGLHDFSIITNDEKAWDLYREGLKAARRETADSDTGAWSLYNVGGHEASLNYHNLVIGFLRKICDETKEDIFCNTREHFSSYLGEAPKITDVKTKVRRKKLIVTFRLSKMSTVSVNSSRGGRAAAGARATIGYGSRRFTLAKPKKKGKYKLKFVAVDLAGNRGSASAVVRVR